VTKDKNYKLIYIAGPYTAETRQKVKINIARAEEVAKQILLLTDYIPIIPHKITSFFETDVAFKNWDSNDWIEKFCLPLLSRCSAIFLVEGWEKSKGAIIENKFATDNNIKVYNYMSDIIINKPWGVINEQEARNQDQRAAL